MEKAKATSTSVLPVTARTIIVRAFPLPLCKHSPSEAYLQMSDLHTTSRQGNSSWFLFQWNENRLTQGEKPHACLRGTEV